MATAHPSTRKHRGDSRRTRRVVVSQKSTALLDLEAGAASGIRKLKSTSRPRSLQALIEAERARLVFVDSLLTCLQAGLVESEIRHRGDSSCADVAEIAQDWVRETIHRLDSVFLRPFLKSLRQPGYQ